MQMGETLEEALRPYWDVDPGSNEARQPDYPAIRDFFYVARRREAGGSPGSGGLWAWREARNRSVSV